mmetsp:Transcript_32892/g.48666  ORF Transcript_32892/g.48666 Transcript_32892/m.48666 type:complete len:251 (-) Transcript_32892:271-1023(-)
MRLLPGNSAKSPLLAFCFSSIDSIRVPSKLFSSSGPDNLRSSIHLKDKEIIRSTRDWFERIVVGWNLCPFAARPSREGKLSYEIVRGTNELDIISIVLGECFVRQEKPGTTLVIAPECCPDDFRGYLEFVATLQDEMLVKEDLADDIQIAPFHPLFEFEDSDNGVDAWTNRSPYPLFHVLREDEVANAVEKLDGDSSKVWQRNINLLEDLEQIIGGETELKEVIRGKSAEHDEIIQEVLKLHRFSLSDEK